MDRLVLRTAVVDFQREEVRGPAGTRIDLRPRAFAVLRCLAANAERLVSKDDLLAECWPGVAVSEDSLAQCISEIRQALGDGARSVIRTVPRRGYLLRPPEAAVSESEVMGPTDYWPAIAVLPFAEFAETPGPLGGGIAAEIITELAGSRDLKVLARHTSFGAVAQGLLPADFARKYNTSYLLEGSISCADGRVLVNVQLIDGHDSRLLWVKRFAASAEAAFAYRGELIARIASSVRAGIHQAETTTALRSVPADLDARELTRRGVAHWRASNRPGYLRARAELERAVALDPDFALPRMLLGGMNASDAAFCMSGVLRHDDLPAAIAQIRHGIALAPASSHGHYSIGTALCFAGSHDEALNVLGRGAALRPDNANILAAHGFALLHVGQYEAGLADMNRAIALHPAPSGYMHGGAAFGLLMLGQFEEALKYARLGRKRAPGFTGSFLCAAHALSALGQSDEAAAQIADLLDYSPKFSMQTPLVRSIVNRNPDILARHLDYLRAAGVPEAD